MSVTGADHNADLIVVNGRVLTMDADNPAAEAIAVHDGAIIAVGSRASIEELKGPATKVIDAKGCSVVPGFIEAHMHLFSGAAELGHLQLSGVHGFEALQAAIRDYASAWPDTKMLVGQGVDYTVLGDERVTRHHLDAILPDRPFVMAAPDHHTMWANTKALELAGILHGRTLGPGNEIVMGEDGLAAGELREGEAFGPVLDLAGEGRVRLG
ncbi:amidohydrolase family protein, partial [Mesorhizobium sp.]